MFGHTLMKLEGRNGHSNAINYSAVFDDAENSLLYAARGVAGGYIGVFAMAPYNEKIDEYSRIENRDLWEYPLLLEPDELRRLLLHLWEMREVEFDYYFFDENCSYQLLTLLDVARPDLHLLAPFPRMIYPHVIPIDTVRALKRGGLIGAPVYRAAHGQTRPDFSPEQGHGSSRVSVGARSDRRGTSLLLRSRDALHDLLDPPRTYLSGGQIEFFNLGLLVNDHGLR